MPQATLTSAVGQDDLDRHVLGSGLGLRLVCPRFVLTEELHTPFIILLVCLLCLFVLLLQREGLHGRLCLCSHVVQAGYESGMAQINAARPRVARLMGHQAQHAEQASCKSVVFGIARATSQISSAYRIIAMHPVSLRSALAAPPATAATAARRQLSVVAAASGPRQAVSSAPLQPPAEAGFRCALCAVYQLLVGSHNACNRASSCDVPTQPRSDSQSSATARLDLLALSRCAA